MHDRGWVEFTVYPLFSPQSLIAEGTANFGIEVAFPGRERVDFERTTLFPPPASTRARRRVLRGAGAGRSAVVRRATRRRGSTSNGKITPADAAAWLERYALYAPDRAKQRVRFFDQYRSYVINYNFGKDLVRRFIESRGGAANRRHAGGRSSSSCCRRRGCRPACSRRAVDVEARCARGGAAVCAAAYVFVYAHRPRRPADPLRRLLLLRLPAGVVPLRRPVAGRGRATTAAAASSPRSPRSSAGRSRSAGSTRIRSASRSCRRRSSSPAHALTRWTNLSPDGFTLLLPARGRPRRACLDDRRPGRCCDGCFCRHFTRWRDRRDARSRCSSAPASFTTRPSTARTAMPTRSSCSRRC